MTFFVLFNHNHLLTRIDRTPVLRTGRRLGRAATTARVNNPSSHRTVGGDRNGAFSSLCVPYFLAVSNCVSPRQIRSADLPGAVARVEDADEGPAAVGESRGPTKARSSRPQVVAIKTVRLVFISFLLILYLLLKQLSDCVCPPLMCNPSKVQLAARRSRTEGEYLCPAVWHTAAHQGLVAKAWMRRCGGAQDVPGVASRSPDGGHAIIL